MDGASGQAPMPDVPVRRLHPEARLPHYAKPGDAGADLCATHEAVLAPGERALVPTGIAMAIPTGWVGLVHPRSGLAAHHGLTVLNAPGTLDAGYRGEVLVNLVNLDATQTARVSPGDRIAQLVLQEVGHARFVDARETEHPLEIITGGETRQESELLALRHLADRIDSGAVDTVLIHDAARPLVSHGLVSAVLHAAREVGGAVPGIPAADVAAVGPGETLVPGGESAGALVRVQTPQGFHAATILDAYEAAARDDFVGTDTASCAEEYTDLPVTWVRGEETNFKITYAQDLLLAQDVVSALGLRSV